METTDRQAALGAADTTLTARAVVLGERIDPLGLERRDALSLTPLAFRSGGGLVVVFRYGVLVSIGLDPPGEDELRRRIAPRVANPLEPAVEEVLQVASGELLEGAPDEGAFRIGALTPDRLLVVADVLAKSAALAANEAEVSKVFDTMEPWARQLSHSGKNPGGRRAMIRLVGSALLVQHRVVARVAVRERPDILWDRPDLERLYARLEDEYELVERAETLARKLELIGETVTAITDLIDTERSLRLEAIIVLLILAEIFLTLFQMARGVH